MNNNEQIYSLAYFALQCLNHLLLLRANQLALREILPQFLQLNLHHPAFVQLILVLLGQSLVVRHFPLQIPHLLYVLRQTHLLTVQALLLL
jgi:hypothetical protein